MGLELATCFITARGNTSQVAGDFRAGTPAVASAAQALQSIVNRILAGIGVGLSIAGIINEMRQAIPLAERQIDAEQRVAAVVKGTGGAAGFTGDQLKKMAAEFQAATTVGDESILELQARMLTFRTITGDTFRQATETCLDLAAAMGTDARTSALQLGRALEDPIRGVSMLRRSGVSFSEVQMKYIKQLVLTNQLQEAQRYILKGVHDQLGTVARDMAKTDVGVLKQQRNVLGDMREELGKLLVPAQTYFVEIQQKYIGLLTRATAFVSAYVRENEGVIHVFKTAAVALGVLTGAVVVYKAAVVAASVAQTLLTASMGPIGLLAIAVGAAAAAWYHFSAKVREASQAIREASEEALKHHEQGTQLLEQLRGLSEQEKLSNDQRKEATGLIAELTRLYGDLGLSIDGTTGKLKGFDEAQKKAEMSAAERLLRETKLAADEAARAYEETFKAKVEGIRWGPFGKMVTEDYAKATAREVMVGGEEDKTRRATEEAYNKAFATVQKLRGLGKSAIDPSQFGLPERPLEMIKAIASQKDAMLGAIDPSGFFRKTFSETMSYGRQKLAEFRPDIDSFMVNWRESHDPIRRAVGFVAEAYKNLTDRSMKPVTTQLDTLREKWAGLLKTPAEEMRESMDELETLWKARLLSLEQFQAGRKMAQKKYEELTKRPEAQGIGPGRFGFAEFGRSLQDMILRADDPQKKTAENTKKTVTELEKVGVGIGEMIGKLSNLTAGALYGKG